jgi:hypothetical protein
MHVSGWAGLQNFAQIRVLIKVAPAPFKSPEGALDYRDAGLSPRRGCKKEVG